MHRALLRSSLSPERDWIGFTTWLLFVRAAHRSPEVSRYHESNETASKLHARRHGHATGVCLPQGTKAFEEFRVHSHPAHHTCKGCSVFDFQQQVGGYPPTLVVEVGAKPANLEPP